MKIKPISDSSFRQYGQLLTGFDFDALLVALNSQPKPTAGVSYVPSCPPLEAQPVAFELQNRYYGGQPIQIGYCNGTNTRLNCLEYHRDSEVNVFEDDTVLLVGRQQDITEDWTYNTALVEAFMAPAGSAIEFFATTLHYAPCDGHRGMGFRAAVVLPRGTNTEKPLFAAHSPEDRLLTARNKWLLALPGTNEANEGAHVGLVGDNIDIQKLI